MDPLDPWQVVPRQVFPPCSHLFIATAFVVVSHIGCLGVTGVVVLHIIICHSELHIKKDFKDNS